jgi:hypothetical protein
LITPDISFVNKVLEFSLVFPALFDDQPAPVDGKDPTDEDVSEEKLENSYHEEGLAPFLTETTNDHCSQTYTLMASVTKLRNSSSNTIFSL